MIISSPSPAVTIPDGSLVHEVLRHERDLADHPALVDGLSGQTINYAQMADLIRRVAGGFAELGIEKGDVVGIYSPNCPDYVIAFHGLAYLGAVTTTINPMYIDDELARQLDHASAKMVITIPALLETTHKAEGIMGGELEGILLFGQDVSELAQSGVIEFDSLKQGPPLENPVAIDSMNDLLALPYSSGTTGLSKGVMITHRNMVANICQFEGVQGYSPTTQADRLIAVLPFYHIYGMMVFMSSAIQRGATIVTMPRFDLEQFLSILQDQKITRAYIAPPIAVALAKHPLVDDYDLSSLNLIFSGAAPLGLELAQAVEARIDCQVVQGYGLTETSPVTNVGLNEEGRKKSDSIGPPICNTEMKVIDLESGIDLPQGETGEVCIRGPQVMKGYLNDPEATAHCIDNEQWFHTGDIGYADEDGYFYIVDRVKELIKYKGYQVAPAELEALLLTHPGVADAAVIGIPDESAGELPKAFLVKKEEVNEDQIKEFVADRVAPYKKIRLVEFVETIPKAPSGKILRRVLRDQ